MAKFTCRIIQDNNGKFRADLCIAGRTVHGLPVNVDYRALREAIRRLTGIEIPKRNQMVFERYNGKYYAMIDATQPRETGCCVTISEILDGWHPDWSVGSDPVLSDGDKAVINAVEGALCMYGSDDVYVLADFDTGMIDVCIYEVGEWMKRVAAISECNLSCLEEAMRYRGVACDFK